MGPARPDGEVVCTVFGGGLGRFCSAESARRLFSRRGQVRLIWIDPDPALSTH